MAREEVRAASFQEFVGSIGVTLTPAQRVFAAVAFDDVEPEALEGDDRQLARDLFGDVDVITEGARGVITAVCGARSGKSYLGALRMLHLSLTVPVDGLAPGENAFAIIVAPDLRLARQALRFALGAAESTPSIARLITSRTEDSFTIARGGGRSVTIECLPATRGGSAVRGRSLVGALMDESAFFRDADGYVVNDAEIFKALAPRIMKGGQLLIESTPWVEAGLLFELFTENFGKPSTTLVAHAPTVLMNPSKAAEVAREYKRDPDNARREFGAQFMTAGSGLFFDPVMIDLAFGPDPDEEPANV